ncbi:MAG: adenylate/guanylate cyclase domain-containing protein, partial [Deltaproteobacteria bacterium]|nr:adenylate/guanylate cyclase domain-containing protein [Deltaproteobacteria bacterium]
GDAVNLASRVESLTKELKQEVLITASVLENIGTQFITEDVGEVPVRGHSPVRLYGVQGEIK